MYLHTIYLVHYTPCIIIHTYIFCYAPGNTFIFNGDFVDRGDKGVEVIATLFALKIAHPENVHLNRGNHEDEHIGRAYGFFEEVRGK
jgi:hypothetical protein